MSLFQHFVVSAGQRCGYFSHMIALSSDNFIDGFVQQIIVNANDTLASRRSLQYQVFARLRTVIIWRQSIPVGSQRSLVFAQGETVLEATHKSPIETRLELRLPTFMDALLVPDLKINKSPPM